MDNNTQSLSRTMRRMVGLSIALFVMSLALFGFSAYATFASPFETPSMHVPLNVGFEGQLIQNVGTPPTPTPVDGTRTLTFTLYTDATDNQSDIWCQTIQDVDIVDGLYSVQLEFGTADASCGSATGADLFTKDTGAGDNGDRYLGVFVENDSDEMLPRIPISSVPFAINAQQAMGLQGNDVSNAAPADGQTLVWQDDPDYEWQPTNPTFPGLMADSSNEAIPNDFFANYRYGVSLSRVDSDTVEVSAGSLMIAGEMRVNTSAVQIDFAGDGGTGLNIGAESGMTEQPDTGYFVYAVPDASSSNFAIVISDNDPQTDGPTGYNDGYRLIGLLTTGPSASPVEIDSVSGAVDLDAGGIPIGPATLGVKAEEVAGAGNTAVAEFVVPGDTLAAGKMLVLELSINAFQNSSGSAPSVTLHYGGDSTSITLRNLSAGSAFRGGTMTIFLHGGSGSITVNAGGVADNFTAGEHDALTADTGIPQVLSITLTQGTDQYVDFEGAVLSGPYN